MTDDQSPTSGAADDTAGSTVENRVYLFKDLAAAFLAEHGAGLSSPDPDERARTRQAFGEVAYAACLVADRDDLEAEDVAELIAAGFEAAEGDDDGGDDDGGDDDGDG